MAECVIAKIRRRPSVASRAPPPTPIATGKGLRTAAVDDRVLSHYLDTSLRVPELYLPVSKSSSHSSSGQIPPEVGLPELLAGDVDAVNDVVAAASVVGAFRVRIGKETEMIVEEVRELVKIWEGDPKIEAEFQWPFPPPANSATSVYTYTELRDKMEKVGSKMAEVAECIARILSENAGKSQKHGMRIGMEKSIICLRWYSSNDHKIEKDDNNSTNNRDIQTHALSMYISGDDLEFFILTDEGSVSFTLSAGCIFIAIRKPLQEWSNGKYKCTIWEPQFVESCNSNSSPSFFLELNCTPDVLNLHLADMKMEQTVSFIDQLFIFLTFVFLYNLWT